MNKVSCTTGLTVGFGASFDAVVLVMLNSLFIRSLPEKKRLVPSGFCSKNKEKEQEHLLKNPKAGIGPILPLGRLLMRRDYRPIIITET